MITLFIAQSLDGYIAGPGGEIDFLDVVNDPAGKEDYGYAEFLRTVDVIVMGRKTWDLTRTFGAWPYPGKECWVLTRQEGLKPQADEKFAPFDVGQWRAASKAGHVWLVGGGEVNRLFFEHGLVGRIVLSTVPVLLGQGLPCFPTGHPRSQWKLDKSQSYPSGLVSNTYVL